MLPILVIALALVLFTFSCIEIKRCEDKFNYLDVSLRGVFIGIAGLLILLVVCHVV